MTHDKREPEVKTPKITTQYRSKGAMIYELECAGGAVLDLHVSTRRHSELEQDEWCIEAHNGHAAGAVVMAEWGPTAGAALERVALAWAARSASLGLPDLDWAGVARALQAVRAV
jgi:hypothetical protein